MNEVHIEQEEVDPAGGEDRREAEHEDKRGHREKKHPKKVSSSYLETIEPKRTSMAILSSISHNRFIGR